MRVDVPQPDAWGRLSDQYRAALAETFPSLKDPGLNVQVYAGVGHAGQRNHEGDRKTFHAQKNDRDRSRCRSVFRSGRRSVF